MSFKLFRRGSARCIGLLSAFVTILLCLYYISMGQPAMPAKDAITSSGGAGGATGTAGGGSGSGTGSFGSSYGSGGTGGKQSYVQRSKTVNGNEFRHIKTIANPTLDKQQHLKQSSSVHETIMTTMAPLDLDNPEWGDKCYVLNEETTNVTTADEFANFDFQPEWIRTKEYWDRGFEERFEAQKTDKTRPPLKVIVVPHSHNDPGWLRTFVNYFQSDSRQILNSMVTKMQEYSDMTFIWSEISFLCLWWDQAHPTKQRALKRLLSEGRFEITTGGWVMTDEANVHLYAMLDQLIEGHQWLKNNLNVTPTVGWSIDPFGHGSTVPYLLSGSNFEGAIIQRIHYAWKQWFARQQNGDFLWMPYWKQQLEKEEQEQRKADKSKQRHGSLLTHNMPFDIYSIKHSCGPHPYICLNFDFRKIPGEYTEYSVKAQFITDENIQEKAQLLLEQYSRTASLFPHNVALIPVGDDFRYNREREIDQQYTNYKKLIDHIMANKRIYNVDISFGTPRDYFRAIRERSKQFPTLKGDFFVYSDIFSEGRPAYWSGYFTTRPFYKMLSADLEHNLRAAEILFTVAYNTALQQRNQNAIKIFEKNYEKMIHARRNLGLFQHHDAITGTSKVAVMRDYGLRLFESIQNVVKMQESTIELLIQDGTDKHNFLLNDLERDNFNKLPRKTPIAIGVAGDYAEGSANASGSTDEKITSASFVIFNPLAQRRLEVVTLRTQTPYVKILDDRGVEIRHIQVNPVWNITEVYDGNTPANGGSAGHIRISNRQYEVMFVADLEALSLVTYQVVIDEVNYKRNMATIFCNECSDSASATTSKPFIVKAKPAGDIQLENDHMRLLFDESSGFMKTITRKQKEKMMKPMQCGIKFASYRSAQFHSGAYLFKPDPEQNEAERDVLDQYDDKRIIITSGPISNDVTVIYGPFLAHTVRIFNCGNYIDRGIYIENDVDFEPAPKNRETELFMRFLTDIDNIITVKPKTIPKESDALPTELPIFYTDQNGFQYHRRIKVPSIGIEGNYFPITSGTFMEDKNVRLTLLTTHAQGAASFEPGQLEVMLDRRTLYDDYRGMGEGITDSRLTRHKFWLLIEDMPAKVNNKYKVPSLLANYFANGLRYPPNLYFSELYDKSSMASLKPKTSLLSSGPLPCDVHLLNFRTLSDETLQLFPKSSALLVLHRQGFDCSVGQDSPQEVCPLSSSGLGHVQFNGLRVSHIEATSLTGLANGPDSRSLRSLSEATLEPMDVRTFNLTFAV